MVVCALQALVRRPRGASDRATAHEKRHRSLATLGNYVRVQRAWTANAATGLSLWRGYVSTASPCL